MTISSVQRGEARTSPNSQPDTTCNNHHSMEEPRANEVYNANKNSSSQEENEFERENISRVLEELEKNSTTNPAEWAAALSVINRLLSSMVSNSNEVDDFDLRDIDLVIRCQTLALTYPSHDLEDTLGWLHDISLSYDTRFEGLGNIEDVNMAIEYREKAVNMSPDGHSRLPVLLNKLGISYLDRFSETEDPIDLDNAIERMSRAISMIPEHDFNWAGWMNNLGVVYLERFRLSKQREDIDKSIETQIKVIPFTAEETGSRLIYLSNLGGRYFERFLAFQDLDDADNAIEKHLLLISLACKENELYPAWLHQLSDYYQGRFDHSHQLGDIDAAIKHRSTAFSLSDSGIHEELPAWLNSLGAAYHSRFKHLGETSDLDCAIEYISRATSLVGTEDDTVFQILQDLSLSYVSRFERFGKPEDIELAIQYQICAILKLPQDYNDLSHWLIHLGDSYDARFDHFGNDADLQVAIELYWQALSLTPKGHEDRPRILQQLGCAYCNRFQQFGELYDIDKAVIYQSQALGLLSDDDPYRVMTMGNLGNSYLRRFERSGNQEDLSNAIQYQSQAVALTPSSHTKKQLWLGNLGNSYWVQYENFGRLRDIDAAIEYLTEALSLISTDHACITLWLGNLGLAHWHRFERLEEMDDINKSILYNSQALSLSLKNASRKALFLNNLGNSYSSRFERLHHVDDLSKATMHHSMAVSITPSDNPSRPHWLGNLGNSYWSRAECTGNREDISKAIECHSQSISALPPGHPSVPLWLVNLGKTYASRFRINGDRDDIAVAIEHQTTAVNLTPPYHSDAPEWHYWLGKSHLLLYQTFSESVSVEKAIGYFRKSAESAVGNPHFMFRSACHWAQLATDQRLPDHLTAYQRAMDLVPQLVWLGTSIDKRYSDIPKLGSLALEAAMTAINSNQYSLALEWLEQGRSIVWNQVLQLRTPLDHLSLVHPVLAQRLGEVASQLHSTASLIRKPLISSKTGVPLEQPNHQHHRLAEEYEQLIRQIRQLEGFQSFLLPKRLSELLKVTRLGPVVIVNIHASRCDALVLQPGSTEVSCIPLTSLSHQKVIEGCEQLRHILDHQDVRHRGPDLSRRPFFEHTQGHDNHFEGMLEMLWCDLVKPVFKFLGYQRITPEGYLPRVTWCNTGPLSFLPIHASGCYNEPGERIFNYAISSYTPTVGVLLSSATFASSHIKGTRILAVGQEVTPGCTNLPGIVPELSHIRTHLGGLYCYKQLDGQFATVDSVLTAMESYDWVHLACHAHQDGQNPSQSGFFLQDGKLTLESISQRAFKNKGLAFLSACQTATGDRIIVDEAVHLASGLLMAGYPSVIATMWSIMDTDAPLIANIFYGLLHQKNMEFSKASWALHSAVAALRADVGEKAFGRWIPFIHMGI